VSCHPSSLSMNSLLRQREIGRAYHFKEGTMHQLSKHYSAPTRRFKLPNSSGSEDDEDQQSNMDCIYNMRLNYSGTKLGVAYGTYNAQYIILLFYYVLKY